MALPKWLNSLLGIQTAKAPATSPTKSSWNPRSQAEIDFQMGVVDPALRGDSAYMARLNELGSEKRKRDEEAARAAQAAAARNASASVNIPAYRPAPIVDYAKQRAEQDRRYEQFLRDSLSEFGIANGFSFSERAFDDAGARAEAEREFLPEFERRRNELGAEVGLNKREANEDWTRTGQELEALRGSNVINQSVRGNQLSEQLGAQGTVRSGIGMRTSGLNTIRGLQENEDVGRKDVANTQIRDLALARQDQFLSNKTGEINRTQETTLAEELLKRRQKFEEAEAKRRIDYSDDYFSKLDRAYTNAYSRAYN